MDIKTIILCIGCLLISSPMLAADYKGVMKNTSKAHPQPISDNSLRGWDGELPTCTDESLPPCWNSLVSPYVEHRIWRPVASMGAGMIKSNNIGSAESFAAETDGASSFIYNPSNPNQSGGIADIFLGMEWQLDSHWLLQGGFDFNQVITEYNASGIVTQSLSPDTQEQFSYSYSVITRQVLAATKLLYTFHSLYHPYVFLGLGTAYNNAYNFTTNVPPPQTFIRLYNNNSATSFVFNIGLGIDINLSETFRLGIGYRYTDLGEVKLGQALIDNTKVSGTLSQTHMYSSVFLAQMTFLL